MISLCSVLLEKIKHYEEIFIKSILSKTKLISEVIFINTDLSVNTYKEWTARGIKFKRYGNIEAVAGMPCGDQHGIGLNVAIEKATNDTVYLCDPDIFFISAVDEFFYDLKTRYDLQAIGCSHHSATELCGTFFPWHGNIMMAKKDLPDNTWLKGNLKVSWLEAGAGHHKKDLYPNPNGNFDTASAMWLLAHEKNWHWIAFQTHNAHLYTSKYYRGNAKIKEKLKPQELLYHAVSGAIEVEAWEPFLKTYNQYSSKSDE
jgi:hypothetical protein